MYLVGDRALLHLGCANEMIARTLLCLASLKQHRSRGPAANTLVDASTDDGAFSCANQFSVPSAA